MITDCFTFFNELELLKVRLEILKDVVDTFVLVESPFTFTGNEKPLYFEKNKDKFKGYNIHHIICEDMPNDGNAWHNEDHQRSKITPPDLTSGWLIIGDLDEIPDPNHVREIHLTGDPNKFYVFRSLTCYYKMNWMSVEWAASKIVHREYMNRISEGNPAKFRNVWEGEDRITVNAGWHFGYLPNGEISESIAYKMRSFSHTEFSDDNTINRTIDDASRMIDPRQRELSLIRTEDLPEYVQNNLDYYRKLGWIG